MNPDPRAPVIVGVGQSLRRPGAATDLAGLPEPATMMVDALRSAGEDSGTGDRLLRRADSVRVVDTLSWHYQNAAALVASDLGADPSETVRSAPGGNGPQLLVNDAAEAIAAGALDIALVAGAEAVQTRLLARQAGHGGSRLRLAWSQQPAEAAPPRLVGHDRPGVSEAEAARSLWLPIQVYPVFENALRAAAGDGLDEHQDADLAAVVALLGRGGPQPLRLVPDRAQRRGDPHDLGPQPHGGLPLSEAHERQHPDRSGRRPRALFRRGGARRRRLA